MAKQKITKEQTMIHKKLKMGHHEPY